MTFKILYVIQLNQNFIIHKKKKIHMNTQNILHRKIKNQN